MNNLNITFWGGVGTVTGANFLLESDKTRLLVDCGLLQGTPEADEINRQSWPYDVKSVQYLFITHAHLDHIGRVCKLVRDGFRGTIYSTPETMELAKVMLADALKVMESNAQDTTRPHATPLYEIADLNTTFTLWKTIPYHVNTKIGDDFSVYLKDAGHILGSSMYEFTHLPSCRLGEISCPLPGLGLKMKKARKIVFTGDSGNSPAPL